MGDRILYPFLLFVVLQCCIIIASLLSQRPFKDHPAKFLFLILNIVLLLVALTIPLQFTQLLDHVTFASSALILFRRTPTPIFYTCCVALLLPGDAWRQGIKTHALLFVMLTAAILACMLIPQENRNYEIAVFSVVTAYKFLYVFLVFRLLHKHQVLLGDVFSAQQQDHVHWIKLIISAVVLSTFVFTYGLFHGRFWVDEANTALYAIALGFTSFFLIRSTRFFSQEVSRLKRQEKKKHKISRVEPAELERIIDRLQHAMREDKFYRRPDLTLSQLSELIGCKPYAVSEALNVSLKTSFYEFVNRYRIEEAVHLLDSDRTQQVIQIAYQVGFNSKSSFNSAFKRFVDKSPTAYRSKIRTGSVKSDDVSI